MATYKNRFRRRNEKIRRIETREGTYGGRRRRGRDLVVTGFKELLPEWWPCLCNGGWDPCPVCGCGLQSEPPCTLCASDIPTVGTSEYWDWQARIQRQNQGRAAEVAAQRADAAAGWPIDDEVDALIEVMWGAISAGDVETAAEASDALAIAYADILRQRRAA